jgi:hypothetical protein
MTPARRPITAIRMRLGARVALLLGLILLGLAPSGVVANAAARWAEQRVPNPNPLGSTDLEGISCTSTRSCVAVGSSTHGKSGSRVLIERWNGAGWSIVSAGRIARSNSAGLNGVRCITPSDCFAVGFDRSRPAIERWDGSHWSVQRTPQTRSIRKGSLYGVACASSTSCIAVGASFGNNAEYALAERWNGRTWSSQRLFNAPGALNSVSCASWGCTVVGGYFNARFDCDLPVVERWNGRGWSRQSVRGDGGRDCADQVLNGVSCASRTRCFAVGETDASGGPWPYGQRWDGSRWSERDPEDALYAVSCRAQACAAVGDGAVDEWHGTGWSNVAPGMTANLLDVSCPAMTACFAVGNDYSRRTYADIPVVVRGP